MNQNHLNTEISETIAAQPAAPEYPDTNLTAFHVICADPNSVAREHATIDHVELWVKAQDYDEAVRRSQEFMGQGWVAITDMSKDTLSECAGYLAGFEDDHNALVMEAAC